MQRILYEKCSLRYLCYPEEENKNLYIQITSSSIKMIIYENINSESILFVGSHYTGASIYVFELGGGGGGARVSKISNFTARSARKVAIHP